MASGKIQLALLMPDRTVCEKETEFVLLQTAEGDMGILHGHQPCAVLLRHGLLRLYDDKNSKQPADVWAVVGGFATVRDNRVVVTTEMAALPEKLEETIQAMERAREQNRQREMKSDAEMHRLEKALRNMLVHMDVSSYSIIKGKEENSENPENPD